jgi:hypothetical protein
MDWKDVLAKLRLIDISPEVKGDQVGAVNVKVENNTYHFHIGAKDVFTAGGPIKITPEFERRVKEEAERRLKALGISPDILSANASTEVASAAIASNSVGMMETIAFKKPKR